MLYGDDRGICSVQNHFCVSAKFEIHSHLKLRGVLDSLSHFAGFFPGSPYQHAPYFEFMGSFSQSQVTSNLS